VLSRVSQTHAVWRTGTALASIARVASRHPTPVGTTFALALNEAATLKLAFTQTVAGRVIKHHCVTQTKHNTNQRACTTAAARATLTLTAHAGDNRIAFDGKISKKRTLTPGRYTLAITATKATKHSARRVLRFTITP
jgi:hypothetical protein